MAPFVSLPFLFQPVGAQSLPAWKNGMIAMIYADRAEPILQLILYHLIRNQL
jgi:hypothetical protein